MSFAQFFQILLARKFLVLGVLSLTIVLTGLVTWLLPKKYSATATIVLDISRPDPVGGIYTSGQMSLPGNLSPSYLATQVKIIESHKVARKVVDSLGLTNNNIIKQQYFESTGGVGNIADWLADVLLQRLSAKSDHRDASNIIDITYEGSDPKFVAVISNAFADAYQQTNLELRVEPARQTTAWFDQQIKELREKLEQAQGALSTFQKEHGITAVDERIDMENSRLSEINSQLVALQSLAIETQSKETRLNQVTKYGQSVGGLPEVIGNALVQSLKADLARSEVKLTDVSKRFDSNHPDYQRALAETQSLRKRVEEEMRVATSGIQNNAAITRQREADLRKALADQKSRILELKQQRDQIMMLNRDVENAQRVYDASLARVSQSRLSGNVTQTDAVVLDSAIPPVKPSSPKVVLNMVLAVFIGALLGVGVAFGIEVNNPLLRTEKELEAVFGIPNVGRFYRTNQRKRRRWYRPWASDGQFAKARP